jgi:hypothetical protein
MTRFLYLVRHGNASPHDGPLSEAGREQARLAGQRLRAVPLAVIHHGALHRAAQTAAIIAQGFPGVPVSASDLAGDYIPSDPDPADLPPRFARLVASFTAAERAEGARLASAAIEQLPVRAGLPAGLATRADQLQRRRASPAGPALDRIPGRRRRSRLADLTRLRVTPG